LDPSFVRSLLSEVRSAFVRSFVRLLRLLRLLRSFASFRFVCFVCFVCFVHLLRLPHLLRSSVRSLLRHFVCLLRSFVCFTRSFVLKMSPSVVASFFVLFSPFVRSFRRPLLSVRSFVLKTCCFVVRSEVRLFAPSFFGSVVGAVVRSEVSSCVRSPRTCSFVWAFVLSCVPAVIVPWSVPVFVCSFVHCFAPSAHVQCRADVVRAITRPGVRLFRSLTLVPTFDGFLVSVRLHVSSGGRDRQSATCNSFHCRLPFSNFFGRKPARSLRPERVKLRSCLDEAAEDIPRCPAARSGPMTPWSRRTATL